MVETKEIKSIPVLEFSTIIAVIFLKLTFIAGVIYYIIDYSTLYQISTYVITLNNNTTAFFESLSKSISAMGALYLIILWPFLSFVLTFILTAIVALLYNFLAPIIGGIKLKIE